MTRTTFRYPSRANGVGGEKTKNHNSTSASARGEVQNTISHVRIVECKQSRFIH